MGQHRAAEATDIFVVGLDEPNLRSLRRLPGAQQYRFRPLLGQDDVQGGEIPIARLLEQAERELDPAGRTGGDRGLLGFPGDHDRADPVPPPRPARPEPGRGAAL